MTPAKMKPASSLPGYWARVFRMTLSIRNNTPEIDVETAHKLAKSQVTKEMENETYGSEGLDLG